MSTHEEPAPQRRAASRASMPVAAERAYELWIWLEARVADFPTTARHGLGHRMLDAAVDLLDAYLRAAYASRQSPTLTEALTTANQRLALLRYLLRGARERRYVSVPQHEHAMQRAAELGRMTGAWLRKVAAPAAAEHAPPG